MEGSVSRAEQGDGDLLSEELKPRRVPPLLASCSTVAPPYKLDYMGTSFGVTSELHGFWRKAGFTSTYLRQIANDTTGEFSCVMLRALNNELSPEWLTSFSGDFRARLLRNFGGPFKNMKVGLALALMEKSDKIDSSASAGPITSASDLTNFITRDDLHRLGKYAQNAAEMSLVLDLMPILAQLFFMNRFPGSPHLSYMQSAILLALGAQRKTIDMVAAEFNVQPSHLMALLNKAVHKLHSLCRKLLEDEVAQIKPKAKLGQDLSHLTLEQEQSKAGKE